MNTVIISLDVEKTLTNDFYRRPGVWALWGTDSKGVYQCLEVGQTANMLEEINEDIEILNMKDSEPCIDCDQTYLASRRFSYSAVFYVHKCKCCKTRCVLREKFAKNNPRRVDKYMSILEQYSHLEFRLVPNSLDKTYKKRLVIEESYAIEHHALYWYS